MNDLNFKNDSSKKPFFKRKKHAHFQVLMHRLSIIKMLNYYLVMLLKEVRLFLVGFHLYQQLSKENYLKQLNAPDF